MGAVCQQCGQEQLTDSADSAEANSVPYRIEETDEVKRFLAQVNLFKRLPQDQHPILASACHRSHFEAGKEIIKQGDEGNEFFIIRDGDASVEVDGQKVATLKSADYFGENALLRDEPRSATIKAITKLTAFRITRDDFVRLGLREKLDFPQRKAVPGGALSAQKAKPPSPKTPEERAAMVEAIQRNANLQSVVKLEDKHINRLIEACWKENVPKGTAVITEGETDADFFYIVASGSFDILVKGGGSKSANTAEANSAFVGKIETGGSFGELALLYLAPRAATVKATSDSVLWVVDRKQFKDVLATSADDTAAEQTGILDKVDILEPLNEEEKKAVAKALTEMTFSSQDVIFEQGEAGDSFYLLISGEVAVIKDNKEVTRLLASPDKAQFFGEGALLNNAPRAATIKVISETAKTLLLDRVSFDILLGPLEELKQRGKNGASKLNSSKPQLEAITKDGKKRFGVIQKKDLKRIGLLGCGGFGAVELVEHVGTQETFALKALSKGYIVKCGMQASIMSEKDLQLLCDSTFIVKLFETFNGMQTLYLLLELALGGELYATYNKRGLFGKEVCAKFYAGGVVNAFEHMHGKKIVFRDLKPENLLLTEEGRMKITDMGLAKLVVGKTYTTCGTPDYFAPELIASSGHTHAVDWWTLGILIFELMSGHPPFESAYPMQIYQKVAKGIHKVSFPAKLKGPCEDLVKSLCKKDPSDRLAMKKGGAQNIRNHSWYKEFSWQAFNSHTMTPPYKPQVKGKTDITNFSARKEDMPPQVEYKDDGTGWDKDFATST
eukprot:TRINITY_DN88965_c0_g1_i1.p1 TRINITY_DN88965_c0_g1~~TRINITY_DN88965_c0_g1_i1.p1  ORF type:complete len:785 (+),score=188.46 TRINITY_DN88965_c0_g1_i1:44-2398(+)